MLSLAAWQLMAPVNRAMAQAVPAGEVPPGEASPTDDLLPGQSLGSNLTLNQGVNAIGAENQSFERYGLGMSASGGVETNFFGTQTNQQSAAYANFAADAGLLLHNERTRYFLLYQPQYNVYPQFTNINSFSQRGYQSLARAISERAALQWDTTAARYLSLNQYLPQSLGIGGIGVVVPTLGSLLEEDSFQVTNVASTVNYKYLINTRMTFSASATGAYFLMIPSRVASPVLNPNLTERFLTVGGDARLTYQLTLRDVVGGAITPIYIDGISPGGHESAETLQATYARELSSTFTARVAAGPLFIQSSTPDFGGFKNVSYSVNASLSRKLRQSEFSVNYARAILVNLLEPAIVSNSIGSTAYEGFGNNWIFTGAGSYTQNAGNGQEYGPGHVFGGSAQLAYQIGRPLQLYALYSVTSQSFSTAVNTPSLGFTRNQFGGGIRFNLGNPVTRGGLQ
jgi:hypothetical protein